MYRTIAAIVCLIFCANVAFGGAVDVESRFLDALSEGARVQALREAAQARTALEAQKFEEEKKKNELIRRLTELEMQFKRQQLTQGETLHQIGLVDSEMRELDDYIGSLYATLPPEEALQKAREAISGTMAIDKGYGPQATMTRQESLNRRLIMTEGLPAAKALEELKRVEYLWRACAMGFREFKLKNALVWREDYRENGKSWADFEKERPEDTMMLTMTEKKYLKSTMKLVEEYTPPQSLDKN